MERDELERWLADENERTVSSPWVVAEALGLPADRLADSTYVRTIVRVRSLRFLLAVLRDVFTDDELMSCWLEMPRRELGGVTARTALLLGQEGEVAALAVRTWNANMLVAGAA